MKIGNVSFGTAAIVTSVGALSASAVALPAGSGTEHLGPLRRLVDRVSHPSLMGGNRVVSLHDGEQAYPAMLDATGRGPSALAQSWTQHFEVRRRCLGEAPAPEVEPALVGRRSTWSRPTVARRTR